MHYTYVLLSETDGRFYTGTTGDLQKRLEQPAGGRVRSTAYRRPLMLLYDEACLEPEDAYRRERFLKTGKGGRYLRNRLASSLSELWKNKSRSTVLERDYSKRLYSCDDCSPSPLPLPRCGGEA